MDNFPEKKGDFTEILKALKARKQKDIAWERGKTFSYIYYASPEIIDQLKHAYELYFCENALNPTAFPSLRDMEIDIIRMCLDLFQGSSDARGCLTSGGTESILMAVKSAKNHRPDIKRPNMVVPSTAHPAFHKAGNYFDVEVRVVPVEIDYRVTAENIEAAIDANTILLVASAPSYPQGVIDPIQEIGQVALKHKLLFHVDACVGGFVLPFLKEQPTFNLSVPGVSSLSADIHKYGFASKGSSVVLYNSAALRKAQYYVYTEWSGGIYASPSILGTKPGGAIAVAWTVLQLLGREGYRALVEQAMDVTRNFMQFLTSFEGISIEGDPAMCIFSISSDLFNIYELGDELQVMGWLMDRQQTPASLHISISPMHAQFFESFKTDFEKAYKKVTGVNVQALKNKATVTLTKGLKRILPKKTFQSITKKSIEQSDKDSKRSAALYGLMGDLDGEGELDQLIIEFLDKLMQ